MNCYIMFGFKLSFMIKSMPLAAAISSELQDIKGLKKIAICLYIIEDGG